MAYC
jgi:hypothetical protein